MRNYVWVFAFLALSAGSVLAARGHGHGGGGGNKNGPVGEKGVFDLYAFSQWWPSTNCAQDNCNREYVPYHSIFLFESRQRSAQSARGNELGRLVAFYSLEYRQFWIQR